MPPFIAQRRRQFISENKDIVVSKVS